MPKKITTSGKAPQHVPVLLEETLEHLSPRPKESYLDLTAGYGGHAAAVLEVTKTPSEATLVDRDEHAIEHLEQFAREGARLIHRDFLSASQALSESGEQFDMILADLGVSSPHLEDASRGFSIANPGGLDMRMDQTQELTAELIVNQWSREQITQILKQFGEEPKADIIAQKIITARPLKTTDQLATIASKAWPGNSRVHPATRTFQALRIAVNSELTQLEQSLPLWHKLLSPGGRLAVISFHSLEDRLVKHYFAEHAADTYDSELTLLTKKPVTAGHNEQVSNPRARSAKLRAVVKNKNKKKG